MTFFNFWVVAGMPCKHATLCISYKIRKLEDYYNEFFHVKTYQAAYKGVIHPLLEAKTFILPLKLKRNPGRPKKIKNKRR